MQHDDTRTSDSTDAKVTQELIETLVDGRDGYSQLADLVADSGRPELAGEFRKMSQQREQMADSLRNLAARYGDAVDSDGSTLAGAHRTWMSVKDTFTGSDPDAAIRAAMSGEDHALSVFATALESTISDDLRATVDVQIAAVRLAREELEGLLSDE